MDGIGGLRDRTSPKIGVTRTIPALTGLRFIAAFSVALAHGITSCFQFDGGPFALQYWIETLAGFGMTLFFVLSGFVIHYNYRSVISGRGIAGVAEFLWARFARLYPLFLLIILVDILFEKPTYYILGADRRALLHTLQALPYFLTFTQSWSYQIFGEHSLIYQVGANAPLTWSISTEWFFYLAYPVILLALATAVRPARSIAYCVACCIIWMTMIYMASYYTVQLNAWAVDRFGPVANMNSSFQDSFIRWMFYFSPYARIGEFILGCLAAHLWNQLAAVPVSRAEARLASVALCMAVVSVPVLLYVMFVPGGHSIIRTWNSNFGLAASVAIIVFTCARYDLRAARLLALPMLLKLGDASYSTYMIHMLVFLVAAASVGSHPATPWTIAILSVRFIFILLVVLLLSIGLHMAYEAPARAWLRGLRRRRGWRQAACVPAALLIAAAASAVGGRQVMGHRSPNAMTVISASYGENCGAPPGNVTSDVQLMCDGLETCGYVVDVARLGDTAPKCGKAFFAQYSCPGTGRRVASIVGEAGFRSIARLSCTEGLPDATK